jgi:hypothetical protein
MVICVPTKLTTCPVHVRRYADDSRRGAMSTRSRRQKGVDIAIGSDFNKRLSNLLLL